MALSDYNGGLGLYITVRLNRALLIIIVIKDDDVD
jgi:hypothetical protein